MDPQMQELSARQSLDIITQMIMEAKGKVRRNSFYFLFWGWVVVIANAGMYALILVEYRHPYVAWAITIPAWIYTLYRAFTQHRTGEMATHFDRISGALWISFGVTLFVLVGFGYKINFQLNPVILIVTAVPTFVSGVILRFKPLMFGGATFWTGGAVAFLVPLEVQPLVSAVTVIAGYLVPGYMLRARNEEVNV